MSIAPSTFHPPTMFSWEGTLSQINTQQCMDEPEVVCYKKDEFCRRIRSLSNRVTQETDALHRFQQYRTELLLSGNASQEDLEQAAMDIAFVKYLINQTCDKLESNCHKWEASKKNMDAEKKRRAGLTVARRHRNAANFGGEPFGHHIGFVTARSLLSPSKRTAEDDNGMEPDPRVAKQNKLN